MTNAVELIRQDHQRVRGLFQRFEQAVTSAQRKEVAEQTVLALEVHAKLEENIFYPAVRDVGGMDLTMNEAEEEHHAAKLLALEVARMDPTNPYFEAKYHVLKEMVLHHMNEEESDILPRAEQVGEGRKSVALRLAFQSPERTLTDEEAAELRARIVQALAERFGAELRA